MKSVGLSINCPRNALIYNRYNFTVRNENDKQLKELVSKSIETSEEILKHAIHEIDNPALTALTCSPDYLRSLTKNCLEPLEYSMELSPTDYTSIIITANKIAHRLSLYILQGRATCNTSPDITFGESNFIPLLMNIVLL